MLPSQYSFHKSPLGVSYQRNKFDLDLDVQVDVDDVEAISAMDTNSPTSSVTSSGFVKREPTFLISSDLTITAFHMFSTFRLLKKYDTDFDDIEEQVISITGAEAISLLNSSLVTSTPLTTALGNFLSSKRKA